jgi:hypothetical protein
VCVEVVYGRPGEDDEIHDPAYLPLTAEGPAQGQLTRFSGTVELGRPGAFGYTVRALPQHRLLANRAELGLVTYPVAPEGMTNGDLRLLAAPAPGAGAPLPVSCGYIPGHPALRTDGRPCNLRVLRAAAVISTWRCLVWVSSYGSRWRTRSRRSGWTGRR